LLVRVVIGWCVLLSSLFAISNAAAASAARIVVVTSGNAELARKVRAEAEHAGILVASEEVASPAGDKALLEKHGAVGVVELSSPDRVRIYVAASGEHGDYRAVVERAPADGDGFALRVVEQVRGRLVELRLLPPEPESRAAPVASTPPEPDTSPGVEVPPPPTLGLAVGGAMSVAAGGIGVAPAIALGLRLEPSARFSASLHALLPVVDNEVNEPEGEASVLVNLFLAELGYRFARPGARFQPEVGAGAGLVVLPLEGEAAPPREGHDDQLVAGVYFLGLGAGYSIEPWLELRAGARVGLSAPRPAIRFSEREVAAWGRPFFAATLAAEFQLPLSSERGAP
jgi:hypothetical protein